MPESTKRNFLILIVAYYLLLLLAVGVNAYHTILNNRILQKRDETFERLEANQMRIEAKIEAIKK